MALLQLKPPDPFNFDSPDEWPRWKRRFQQFRDASGLAGEAELKQVNTLLYCMGETAEDVLNSTNPTDAERKEYKLIITKFDTFFKVRKNVIFERARFNSRNQKGNQRTNTSQPSTSWRRTAIIQGSLKAR